jgi:hypothetical protein
VDFDQIERLASSCEKNRLKNGHVPLGGLKSCRGHRGIWAQLAHISLDEMIDPVESSKTDGD